MSKTRIIKNKDELNKLRAEIMGSLDQSVVMIQELMSSMDSLSFFKKIKFEKTVTDSFTGEPENFAEMIDQCQTYLVSIMAVEYLIQKHQGVSFKINFGNVSGYDIESVDGDIVAECFAATSYRSNGKLTADLKRLKENSIATYKYEFFYDKEFTESHKQYYKKNYSDITFLYI